MIITMTPKKAKFSAAHSLACFGPDHPCARKHGHTWWVEATFAGRPVDGILIDYEVIEEVARSYDHTDLDEIIDGLASGENIVGDLVEAYRQRCTRQGDHVAVVRVRLFEDPIPGDVHCVTWVASEREMATRFDPDEIGAIRAAMAC